MSPAMSALSSVGISHSMLLLGVLFVVTAVILGMYWHIIVPGAIMLTVAFLFIEPATVAKTDEPVKVEEAKAPPIDEDKMAFMEDCTVVADYPKAKCEQLWSERLIAEKQMAEEYKPMDVSYKRQIRHVKYH